MPDLTQLGASVGTTPDGARRQLMRVGRRPAIAERAALAYLLIGVVDYIWQRRRFEKA